MNKNLCNEVTRVSMAIQKRNWGNGENGRRDCVGFIYELKFQVQSKYKTMHIISSFNVMKKASYFIKKMFCIKFVRMRENFY